MAYRVRAMSGSWRCRTSEKAVRTRGDASVSVGWYIGSEATTTAIAASASDAAPEGEQAQRSVLLDRAEVGGIATLLLPDTIQHRQRFVVARRGVQVASHVQRATLSMSRGGKTGRQRGGQAQDEQSV